MLFQSTSDTIVAGMVLSLIYLKMIQLLKPFTDPGLNRIKETSIWQIFFVLFIALLLKTRAVNSDFLTVCLLLAFFANFILLLGQYLWQYGLQHLLLHHMKKMQRDEVVESGADKEMDLEMEDRHTSSPPAPARKEQQQKQCGGGGRSSYINPNGERMENEEIFCPRSSGCVEDAASKTTQTTRSPSTSTRRSDEDTSGGQIISPFHHKTTSSSS